MSLFWSLWRCAIRLGVALLDFFHAVKPLKINPIFAYEFWYRALDISARLSRVKCISSLIMQWISCWLGNSFEWKCRHREDAIKRVQIMMCAGRWIDICSRCVFMPLLLCVHTRARAHDGNMIVWHLVGWKKAKQISFFRCAQAGWVANEENIQYAQAHAEKRHTTADDVLCYRCFSAKCTDGASQHISWVYHAKYRYTYAFDIVVVEWLDAVCRPSNIRTHRKWRDSTIFQFVVVISSHSMDTFVRTSFAN